MPSYSGTFTLSAQMQANASGLWPPNYVPTGQQAYTTAGTYSWVAPTGVTSVSVVAVGGGGPFGFYNENYQEGGLFFRYGPGGGGGGGLGWKNNITVVPGNSYTVVVGAPGLAPVAFNTNPTNGGDSYFINASTVRGGGGTGGTSINQRGFGGTFTGQGGGNGGDGANGGGAYQGSGGGAGGYSGNGGAGVTIGNNGNPGSGGGGGSAGFTYGTSNGGSGGVGLLGQGANGAGGTTASNASSPGGGGSGGASGGVGLAPANPQGSTGGSGGAYGGAMGTSNYGGYVNTNTPFQSSPAGGGAVRIIWPGTTRSFPSTNTGDL